MSTIPGSTLADSERLIADLQRQLAECRAERDEALAQQTATAEVFLEPFDLATAVFSKVRVTVRHDLLRIPFSFCILELSL